MPQRMIDNEFLLHLENAGGLSRLLLALGSAWKFKQRTGMSVADMLKTALKALKDEDMGIAQTLMAANAPVIIQRAIVEGKPAEGVLPSGQVAVAINQLPPVAEMIAAMVNTARVRAAALAQGE